MATINPSVTRSNTGFGTLIEVAWVGATDADTLTPHEWQSRAEYATMQVYGSLGAPAATVDVECSVDGSTFYPILDVDGNSVSGTTAALKKVRATGKSVRPSVTGGTSESVNVAIAYRA